MNNILSKLVIFKVFFLGIILLVACQPKSGTSLKENVPKSEIVDSESNIVSLTDRLRMVSGVSVVGSGRSATVRIRSGGSSFLGDSEPLFVVDDQIIMGGLASVIDLVNVLSIKRINVLKSASDISFYGVRGANGVIEIELK